MQLRFIALSLCSVVAFGVALIYRTYTNAELYDILCYILQHYLYTQKQNL